MAVAFQNAGFGTRIALAVLMTAGSLGTTLAVAENAKSEIYDFDIPAQKLNDALQALAFVSQHKLLYSSKLVDGKESPLLKGKYTTAEAVAKLLSGTTLSYQVTTDGLVVIRGAAVDSTGKLDGEDHLAGKSQHCAGISDAELDSATALNWTASDRSSDCVDGYSRGLQVLASAEGDAVQNSEGDSNLNMESTGDNTLEEIVVTAQRREERLIDTPISIGVLSGDALDRSSARGVSDILDRVGGVSLIETQPGQTQIAIRGVVADAVFGTSTSGYYLDEVPFSFVTNSQLPDANAFDLSRVEVLRGPQGTLYGANALSGVVRILTNDANVDEFEGKARIRASDTADADGANYGGDLAVNVPLVAGKLAIRAVASYAELGGYVDSPSTGHRGINDSEVQAYRLKTTYKPNDDLSFKLGLSRSRIENGGPSQSDEELITPFSDNQGDERVYDTYNLVAEYRWPSLSLLSSTSYLDYRADTQQEINLLNLFDLNYFNRFQVRSFSQEFRLSSHLEGPWQWSAGGYYKDAKQDQYQNAAPVLTFPFHDHNQSESYAVFSEATRSFGAFELTGGVRYFRDDLVTTELSNFSGAPVFAPRPADFDRITGRLVLTYKPQANRTFYGSVATGFRSGINQTSEVIHQDPNFPPATPDSLITYEVGAKANSFDGAVTYDVAVYYTDWTDIQQSIAIPAGFFAGVNAGSATGAGIDGGIEYRPIRALSLRANIGWNGLELDEEIRQPGTGILLFSKGDRVNSSPEWTGSLGGTFSIATPMTDTQLVLSTNYSYRSRLIYRYLQSNVVTDAESDTVQALNASLGLQGKRWSADLYGDNLLDNRDSITAPDVLYHFNSIRQRPRTIGLQLTFNY